MENILKINTREDFYTWLSQNHTTQQECWIEVKRGNPQNAIGILPYLDAVEVALCFGWIDSTTKIFDNIRIQRFSPRQKNSPWTELNKERCRRLIKLNEMQQCGLDICPDLNKKYVFPEYIIEELKKDKQAYNFFYSCPILYQNIRIYNINFYYKRNKQTYQTALNNLIQKSHNKKMYGEWNDYGRLLNY